MCVKEYLKNIKEQNASSESMTTNWYNYRSCTLYNFIRLHEQGIPISPRPTNVVTIPNVWLYDGRNSEVKNEFRDTIYNMISSSIDR